MNVLLVYPEVPDTFWSFKHALRFIGKKASSQPLGLLTVAAMLPDNWEKRLVDINCEALSQKDLMWADYVFISAMSIQKKSARNIIEQCNDADKTIVAGGPLFTAEYKDFDTVDHFVLNEAEITLVDFLNDLENGTPKKMYTSAEFPDITESPRPLWDLADFDNYATMNIQYSRGCPYNCDFCNITTLFGHKPRIKSVDQVINELDSLYNSGWRKGVFFVDDNFIGNKKTLKKDLLPALINWRKDKKGISFTTEASINLADDEELMKLMVDAGFDAVFIGIETPEELSLTECNKKQNLNRDLIECVRQIHRSGLQVRAGFILGFDSDTPLSFSTLVNFIQNSGIVTAMVGLLQAPVDSLLYKRLKKEGRILNNMSGDNADGSTNIIPRMDIEALSKGYNFVVNQLYSPSLFSKRVKTFLKEYKAPKTKLKNDFRNIHEDIMAFFRSIYILGIKDKERLQYWKLFFWTLIRRPLKMNLAITFAIYGYHFRTICENQA
ncbi:MAG: B12-binding domain-containing radical SAM protein [Candidatus Kapaibacterium sp.]